jgi:hypothetical protein
LTCAPSLDAEDIGGADLDLLSIELNERCAIADQPVFVARIHRTIRGLACGKVKRSGAG